MSVTRFLALVFLVMFSGSGVLVLLGGLKQRLVHPEEVNSPIAGLGSVGLGIFLFLALWFGFAFTQPPVTFMRALRDGDDATAYAQLVPALQAEFDGLEGFVAWAEPLRPQRWFFMSSCSGWSLGRSDGTGRFQSGERFQVSFHLSRDDEGWLIQGIDYWGMEPAYHVGISSFLDCSD